MVEAGVDGGLRGQGMLPYEDRECLEAQRLQYIAVLEDRMICLVLRDYPLPDGLRPARSDLLLRLSPGYPDVAPEMWWFDPPIRRPDGQPIAQTDVTEHYLGRTWQRWSRHFDAGQWRPGVDSLQSFLALLSRELARSQPAL